MPVSVTAVLKVVIIESMSASSLFMMAKVSIRLAFLDEKHVAS